MSAADDRQPCPSDLVLDRYLVGELGGDELRALEDHAGGCDRCQTLLDERRAEARRYAEAPALPSRAAETLARLQDARLARWWSRPRVWVVGLTGAAAAAALAVVVLRGELLHPGGEADSLRLKGGLALSAFVKRGELVEPARSGEVFHPGDALRFSYSTDRDGYLAIVSVDAKQVVSVYHPVDRDPAPAAPAGAGKLLPGSTILDATLGAETVIAVHCPRPFAVAAVRQRAGPLVSALRSGRAVAPLLPESGCRVARFELRKESAR